MRTGPLIAIVGLLALSVGSGGTLLVVKSVERIERDAEEEEARTKAARPESETAADSRMVDVRVSRVERGTLTPTIVAYGTVEPDPSAAAVVAWPAEIVVREVLVVPGESVAAQQPVVQVALSPDAELQRDLAEKDVLAARSALDAARTRLGLKLGTQQEVTAGASALASAEARLARMRAAVPPPGGVLRASRAGIVRSVAAVTDATTAAGAALVTIAPAERRVVALGVEPASAALLAGNESVVLTLPGVGDAPLAGHVERVLSSVAPGTRLQSVIVAFDAASGVAEGATLRATIERKPIDGALIVPRSAILPTAEGEIVFVVDDDRAHERRVRTAERNGDLVRVVDGLKEGESIVVQGAADLDDGQAVHVVERHR
ncbi:MAG: efflux RND transporter periplasmic adaptor subunit [Phycisphaerales bacterium]